MSFGDLVSTPSLHNGGSSPQFGELSRLLKPLALNNAALRQTAAELAHSSAPSPVTLRRMRALRDQNRHIATAAATLAAQGGEDVESDAAVRSKLKSLLDEFSTALSESLTVERSVLSRVNSSTTSTTSPSSSQAFDSNHATSLVSRSDSSSLTSTNTKESIAGGGGDGERGGDIMENDLPLHLHHSRKEETSEESSPLINQQQQQQHAPYKSADMRDAFVAERRTALADIQASVDDVNTIFKDLAGMVDDQRSQVDFIDVAIAETAVRVDAGRRQLEKTQRRRDGRKSFFFCTLFAVAFIIAILLIVVLS